MWLFKNGNFFTEAVTDFYIEAGIPQKKLILCDYVSLLMGFSQTTKCFRGMLFYLILSRAAPGFTDMTLRGHSSVFVGLNVTLCFSPVTEPAFQWRRGVAAKGSFLKEEKDTIRKEML